MTQQLIRWRGLLVSVQSGTPDLAERHDVYLAETSADDHN
jgi:hypothetical protein